MNNYIIVGKIINTFGIKGELKVISDFEYKERIFKEGTPIYIGINKDKEIIQSRRVHKNNDLILFKGYTNINEVLKYKGSNIYILRSDLFLEDGEYLLNDLIGLNVYDKELLLGTVLDYEKTINNVLLKIKGDKTFYIPLIDNYIIKVDLKNKKIDTNNGKDLIV